jgi:hypothetical protein
MASPAQMNALNLNPTQQQQAGMPPPPAPGAVTPTPGAPAVGTMPPPPAAGTGVANDQNGGINPQTGLPWGQQPGTAMQPAPGDHSQWGDNPLNVMPPPPNSGGFYGGSAATEKNVYGGQKIAGADPSQADYDSVQGYADQAYDQARRRIDPMQEQQGRRMEQDLINKGIDPSSPQGMAMLDQQNRDFSDQNNSATFGSLQFGQGIQNQMAQQEQQKAQLGGDMQKALWENNYNWGGLANQRYGMDQNFQLGAGALDYQRGMGEHDQMMDLLGYDMNVQQFNRTGDMMQDALYNQVYSGVPVPGMSATNPYAPADTMMGAGDTTWWNAGTEVGIG